MVNLPVGDIIRDSFKLAWRHKYLWLFGVFTAGNTFGNINLGRDSIDIDTAKEWILAALAIIILVGLAVFIVYLILHAISKSALIYNVYQVVTNGVHGVGTGWDFGLQRFWPMLGLTLLQIVIMVAFVFALVLVEVVLFLISIVLGLFSLLFAIPALLAGIMALSVIWTYAERFVALETRGVIEAIGEGVSLLRSQWRPSLIMLLVKIGIAIAIGVGLFGIGIALSLPAIAMWIVSKPLAILYGIVILLPYAVLAAAYVGTFDSAVWTKVFLQLRAPVYAGASAADAGPPEPRGDSEPPRASPPIFE